VVLGRLLEMAANTNLHGDAAVTTYIDEALG
jgi:hypothetical protein